MLTFLKEFPDKHLVALVFLIVFAAYLCTGITFLERLQDGLLGAFIALVVSRPSKELKPSTVQAETVERAEITLAPSEK